MSLLRRGGRLSSPRRERGFGMIEVLVALVVMAIGLLGFALVQTMNLRFTHSFNQRTQATNLAYDLLDHIRTDRHNAVDYAGAAGADFAAGTVPVNTEACRPTTGAALSASAATRRWQCQVVRALGPTASAQVTVVNRVVTVTVTWQDQRWNRLAPTATTGGVFRLESRI